MTLTLRVLPCVFVHELWFAVHAQHGFAHSRAFSWVTPTCSAIYKIKWPCRLCLTANFVMSIWSPCGDEGILGGFSLKWHHYQWPPSISALDQSQNST